MSKFEFFINISQLSLKTILTWLQPFWKQNEDFSLCHRKGPPRATCSTSFIYLCLAGPDLNQEVCQGSWGKMTLQGYEKFITIKYQVMNNKCTHYFVHYMTASFKMYIFFLIVRPHYKSINRDFYYPSRNFEKARQDTRKKAFLTCAIVNVNILNTICSFINEHKNVSGKFVWNFKFLEGQTRHLHIWFNYINIIIC